jgi:hypothetical protein
MRRTHPAGHSERSDLVEAGLAYLYQEAPLPEREVHA